MNKSPLTPLAKEGNDALAQLKQTVAASNITQVAHKMGVPRCTLSLVVNGKYPASPAKILAKFEAAFGGVYCPHLNTDLTRSQCADFHKRGRPSNPLGLQHWKACQTCPHKGD